MYETRLYGRPEDTAADVARVTISTAGGAASGAGAAAAAAPLFVAAGASAAVPVAGWIAAGVLGAAGGTVALVAAIKNKKISDKAAVKLAKKLGLPDPERMPGFTARALDLSKSKRAKLEAQYATAIKNKSSKKSLFPKAQKKAIAVLKAKLRMLKAIDAYERGELHPTVRKSVASSPAVNQVYLPVPLSVEPEASEIPIWVFGIGIAAIVGAALLARKGGSKK